MIREYRTVEEIVSPLMMVRMVENVTYDELVEVELQDGSIRRGLIGMVDLDAYDYSTGSVSPIRATERTVVERIPPRMRVRREAPVELPHILMLADDHDHVLIEPIAEKKDKLEKLYDFDQGHREQDL